MVHAEGQESRKLTHLGGEIWGFLSRMLSVCVCTVCMYMGGMVFGGLVLIV